MIEFANLLFIINVAWIMTHELDAVQQHEWRVLPLTSWMSEEWGYRVFIMLHIPLFVLLMVGIESRDFQFGFDIFLLIHVGLHWLFRHHPAYTFDNALSQFLIVGVAPLAVGHLFLMMP